MRASRLGLELPPVEQLAFERGGEALAYRVVVGVADGSHRGPDAANTMKLINFETQNLIVHESGWQQLPHRRGGRPESAINCDPVGILGQTEGGFDEQSACGLGAWIAIPSDPSPHNVAIT